MVPCSLWKWLPPEISVSHHSTALTPLHLLSLLLASRLFTALYNTCFGDVHSRQFIFCLESPPQSPSLVPGLSWSVLGHMAMSLKPYTELAPSQSCSSLHPLLYALCLVYAAIHHPHCTNRGLVAFCSSQASAAWPQGGLCSRAGHSANTNHFRGLHYPRLPARRALASS